VNTRTIVIGLGNPLLSDDAIGLAALAQLAARYVIAADVELHDGGTWGMKLLPAIESAGRVLFLDAIDTGEAPGTLTRLEGEKIPQTLATLMSPHQIDLREVLAVCALRGTTPHDMVALGLQPEHMSTQVGMSDVVAARVNQLADEAAAVLASWGHPIQPRESVAGLTAPATR
jgi:hydrogenase maturation protease